MTLNGREAIATLVSTREYALGAVVLARTLIATGLGLKKDSKSSKKGTRVPLIALVTPHGYGGKELTQDELGWLESAGWIVVKVPCLAHREGKKRSFLRPDLAQVSFSKLHLWSMEEYDRIIFFDAGMCFFCVYMCLYSLTRLCVFIHE